MMEQAKREGITVQYFKSEEEEEEEEEDCGDDEYESSTNHRHYAAVEMDKKRNTSSSFSESNSTRTRRRDNHLFVLNEEEHQSGNCSEHDNEISSGEGSSDNSTTLAVNFPKLDYSMLNDVSSVNTCSSNRSRVTCSSTCGTIGAPREDVYGLEITMTQILRLLQYESVCHFGLIHLLEQVVGTQWQPLLV